MVSLLRVLGAVGLLTGGIAFAATDELSDTEEKKLNTPAFRVDANGGVADYARGLTSGTGPAYGVIVGLQAARWVGVEAQYQGATNSLDSATAGGFDRLTTNNLIADVKLGLPVLDRFTPFVFGGAGWANLRQNGAGGTANQSDNLLVVPLGAGVESRLYDRVRLGARFTYDFLMTDPGQIANAQDNIDMWAATVNLGASLP